MHIPDGFVNGATAAGAGVVAVGGLGASLRLAGAHLQERRIPLAGLVAALIFALQMINFPVAAGTSGHLLGGAVAVILLGPSLGIVAVSVVVIVQALLFADGGITALGLNVVNMAVVTGIVGWMVFRLVRAVLPKTGSVVVGATFIAALVSVVASAAAFVFEYALGGAGGVDLVAVFRAMVGVHVLIGIGEGLISAALVASVRAVRPDLVHGAADVAGTDGASRLSFAGFVGVGVAVTAALVFLVAPLADSNPDGLERVAIDHGFAEDGEDSATADGPLADYGLDGVSEPVGTGVAGAIGAAVVLVAGVGLLTIFGRRRRNAMPVDHTTL